MRVNFGQGICFLICVVLACPTLRAHDDTLDFEEVGYFDTYDADNNVNFNGAWSVFPYFDSGTILVNDRQNGLFVLSVVPEPGSLVVLGLSSLAFVARRRRRV